VKQSDNTVLYVKMEISARWK